MTIIESLRQYFMQFPELAEKRLNIDCLSSGVDSYSIDSVPGESVISQYIDGTTVRRFLFTISSRMYHSTDLTQQANNLAFFEALDGWLSQQILLMAMPDMGAKRRARSLEVNSSAYPIIVDDDSGTARYQMQLQLIYLQEV
jgi:hypothetical protein